MEMQLRTGKEESGKQVGGGIPNQKRQKTNNKK